MAATGTGTSTSVGGTSRFTGGAATAATDLRRRRISIQMSSPPRAATTVKASWSRGGRRCSTAPNSCSESWAAEGSNCCSMPVIAPRFRICDDSSCVPAPTTTYGRSPTCITRASPSARTIAVRRDSTSAILQSAKGARVPQVPEYQVCQSAVPWPACQAVYRRALACTLARLAPWHLLSSSAAARADVSETVRPGAGSSGRTAEAPRERW